MEVVQNSSPHATQADSAGVLLTDRTARPLVRAAVARLQGKIRGRTWVLGAEAVWLVRSKPRELTVLADVDALPDRTILPSVTEDVARRMSSYLARLVMTRRRMGGVDAPDALEGIFVVDVTQPKRGASFVDASASLASRIGGRHLFATSERALLEADVDVGFGDGDGVLWAKMIHFSSSNTRSVAVIGANAKSRRLWSGGAATGHEAADVAADHASIVFLRKHLAHEEREDILLDRIVRLLEAGKRVVLIDAGEHDGDGLLGRLYAHTPFRALGPDAHERLDAI